jgi:hypothetical protein
LAITVTTTDVTLTLTQGTSVATNIGSTTAQYAILNVSGAMTAARNLILPSSSRQYVINNACTGGFLLTVKGSATTGVTLVNGEKAHVFWNGSDYAKVSNTAGTGSFTDLTVSGSLTLSGGTANGVAYLNGSKVLTTGSALTFDGTNLTQTAGTPVFTVFETASGNNNRLILTQSSGLITYNLTYTSPSTNAHVFQLGGAEQMRLTSTGLGIGTSSPVAKLDVVGAANTGDPALPFQLRIASTEAYNTTPTSGIMFLNKYNTGGSYAGMGGISVYKENTTDGDFGSALGLFTRPTAGSVTKVATFSSSGNLGLGVTPSAWTAYKGIQINTVSSLVGSSGSTDLGMNWYYASGDKYLTTGPASRLTQYNGAFQWYNAPSGTAGNAITFTQAMTLDTSGNLGVGTSSPAYTLDVQKALGSISVTSTTGTNYAKLQVNNTGGSYQFGIDNSAGTNFGSGVAYSRVIWNDSATAPTIVYTSSTERMRIASDGSVGIGTSSPAYKLHVANTVAATAAVQDVAYFSADSTGSTTSAFGARLLLATENANGNMWPAGIAALNSSAGSNLSELGFYTATAGPTLTERMRIDSSGRLLLGSSTVDANLGTKGFQITSNETCQIIQCTDATGQAVRFYSSTSTQAGYITVNGAAASYNSASDYRLKENVIPLVGALAVVNGLRPVKYTWKVDGNAGEGFIAHELQESIPLAVQGTKDQLDSKGNISPQGIDQSKIVPYLVKAIQEQQALITSLTARITALEST